MQRYSKNVKMVIMHVKSFVKHQFVSNLLFICSDLRVSAFQSFKQIVVRK